MRTPIFEDSDLDKLKDIKTKFVKAQDYETAARLRDFEKILIDKVDADNEIRFKNLNEKQTLTKEEANTMVSIANKELHDKIRTLERNLEDSERRYKNLENKSLTNVHMSMDYGFFILENYQIVHTNTSLDGITDYKVDKKFKKNGSDNLYTNEDVYLHFMNERLAELENVKNDGEKSS